MLILCNSHLFEDFATIVSSMFKTRIVRDTVLVCGCRNPESKRYGMIYSLQLHHHSRLNTWLQWIGQKRLQDEMRHIYVLGFGAPYIRGLTVLIHGLLFPTFKQMADHGKVEVSLEAQPHRVIQLLEMPLQGFTGLHHHPLQALKVKVIRGQGQYQGLMMFPHLECWLSINNHIWAQRILSWRYKV